MSTIDMYHREVVEALRAIGDPSLGDAIQKDRGSALVHLGIPFPLLRRRVKQGFSFYQLSDERILEVWDTLWQTSAYGDALFAALEYYAPRVRKQVHPAYWPVMRHWWERVDNWCHSDTLSLVYSWLLEDDVDSVYPQLVSWNSAESEWSRRISLVSLIHNSGKNAVFLPTERVLPLVTNCLDDRRQYVQLAVGWVLRETGRAHHHEVMEYLEIHAERMGAAALARATEQLSGEARARLRERRRQ